jgi:hypothetical protein
MPVMGSFSDESQQSTLGPNAFVCEFCGAPCSEGERMSLEIPLAEEGYQQFFVHWKCMSRAVHEQMMLLDVEEYEQNLLNTRSQT